MSDTNTAPVPTEISLHQKSHLLVISFEPDIRFELPCEYLRIFSRAAEVRTLEQPETGKEHVNIDKIEAQGSYAIRIFFDDGHNTGIYSWETLYNLGKNQEKNWQQYLDALTAMGYIRNSVNALTEKRTVTLLYFVNLVRDLGKETEQVTLPESVKDITSLLKWLRTRGKKWARLLQDDRVQTTVNKAFAEPFTVLEAGDEIAIVPCGGLGKTPEDV